MSLILYSEMALERCKLYKEASSLAARYNPP